MFRGTTATQAARHMRSRRRLRMDLGYAMCRGIYGNGPTTGGGSTHLRLRRILRGRQPVRVSPFGAAVFSMTPTTAGHRRATTPTVRGRDTQSASASRAIRNQLPHASSFAYPLFTGIYRSFLDHFCPLTGGTHFARRYLPVNLLLHIGHIGDTSVRAHG